jgi:hypothetical protein
VGQIVGFFADAKEHTQGLTRRRLGNYPFPTLWAEINKANGLRGLDWKNSGRVF